MRGGGGGAQRLTFIEAAAPGNHNARSSPVLEPWRFLIRERPKKGPKPLEKREGRHKVKDHPTDASLNRHACILSKGHGLFPHARATAQDSPTTFISKLDSIKHSKYLIDKTGTPPASNKQHGYIVKGREAGEADP